MLKDGGHYRDFPELRYMPPSTLAGTAISRPVALKLRGIRVGIALARGSRAGATMLRLKARQRTALGETLRALANLAATALALSQFVGQQSPSWQLIVAGVSQWFGFVWNALWLIGDD